MRLSYRRSVRNMKMEKVVMMLMMIDEGVVKEKDHPIDGDRTFEILG